MEYTQQVKMELFYWRQTLNKPPKATKKLAKTVQDKVNQVIPEQFHQIVTTAIREMVKGVISGAEYTVHPPQIGITLEERDKRVHELTQKYKLVAMAEGAGTGAGGLIIGMADFPLLLSIKIKYLYEVAAIYGFNVQDYRERIYLLSIFELAFSSADHTKTVYDRFEKWKLYKQTLPEDLEQFDWMKFQQEYRDYMDLAKIFQLVPVIGAPVGAYANHQLMKKLGYTAMQAYRMRWIYH